MSKLNIIKKYRLSLIGFAIATVIFLISVIYDLDFFERFVTSLSIMEAYEIDEFVIPLFIFIVFILFNVFKRKKEYKIKHEKLIIYKAMLSSSHHVLNNFLYQMEIFKMTAEETPGFDADVLKLYDEIIEKASKQINSLATIDTIDEASIVDSVAPKIPSD